MLYIDVHVTCFRRLPQIRMEHDVYPEHTVQAARQVLLINDIEVLDLHCDSRYNKMFYFYDSHDLPKRTITSVVQVKVKHERTDLHLPHRTEAVVKVTLQPLRFNINQVRRLLSQ